MQKIPTLFKRDPENPRYVTDEINEGCEWVLAGDGVATRKYDGTCVMFDGEHWWARREVKSGGIHPVNFMFVSYDPVTEKTMGWEPIEQSSFYKFWEEAIAVGTPDMGAWTEGTYELCGPKINRNPEDLSVHELVRHETATQVGLLGGGVLKTFAETGADVVKHIKIVVGDILAKEGFEGIVWHHPDGRMAKLKACDIKKED